MIRKIFYSITISCLALTLAWPAQAGSRHRQKGEVSQESFSKRGGYSYSYADSINTYGNSRTNYGSADVYRDPNLDKQTNSGPFDHGFFFDSGMGSHGGDSPYMN